MNTVDKVSGGTISKKIITGNSIVWDVFKGLFIAAVILAVVFNTFVSICYVIELNQPIQLEMKTPYYMETQDYLDLTAMQKKAPDSAEYKAMLKAFNTKYSVPYENSQVYIELAKAHKEDPNSKEYQELLEKFQEQFDIPAEKIIFED